MLKKIILFNLILSILTSSFVVVLADDEIDNVDIEGIETVIQTATQASELPKINSRYAVVMDRQSKSILYGKNERNQTKMASTTKIMTALIVIENTNLNNIVEISKKAAATGGSRLKIKAGDKIKVKDLLYGLMLRSGNDAAVALAEYVGGSVAAFATLMNQKAQELGLANTHFETPHGLDSQAHYTTAYELAILTDYALNNQVFASIVKTKSCTITINGNARTISNTNELLGNLNGVYGVKTGFTNGAGRCLVTAIKRGDLDIICVALGADTKKMRTSDSIKLIEYTFHHFKKFNIGEKIEEAFNQWKNTNEEKICIEKGIQKGIKIKLDEYNLKQYPIKKGTEDKITVQIQCAFNLKAPIQENRSIGNLVVSYDKMVLSNIPILTAESIRKKGMMDYIIEIGKNYNYYLQEVV